MATEPTLEKDLWTSRTFLVCVAEFELAVGLWLAAGIWAPGARLVALGFFAAACLVSLSKALNHESSCGCFGKLPGYGKLTVDPWLTAALDLSACAALWWWRPAPHQNRRSCSHVVACLGTVLVFLLMGVPMGFVAANYRPTTLEADGAFEGTGRIVLLEPEQWIGQRLPLLKYIDLAEGDLGHGSWLVALWRFDCATCKEEIPRLEQRARLAAADPAQPRIALIEVPPYGPPGYRPVSADSPCRLGALSEAKNWFVTTPAVLRLQDGIVLATERADALH